jgi:hypothetical protein
MSTTTYPIVLTDAAKALAKEAGYTEAEVEAWVRECVDIDIIGVHLGCEPKPPSWGFHTVAMPNGTEFLAWFDGMRSPMEIDAIGGQETAGPIPAEIAEWLGVEPADVVFPVRATKKGAGRGGSRAAPLCFRTP